MQTLIATVLSLALLTGSACRAASLTRSSPETSADKTLLETLPGGVWEARLETAKGVTLYSESFEPVLGKKFLLARQTIKSTEGAVLRETIGIMGRDPAVDRFCSWVFLSDGGTARACAVAAESERVWLFEGDFVLNDGTTRRLRTRFSLPKADLLVNEVRYFDETTASWSAPSVLEFRRIR